MRKPTKIIPFALFFIFANNGIADVFDEHWSIVDAEDSGNNKSVISLRQESTDTVMDENGKDVFHPTLDFQCIAGSRPIINFRIDWHRFISSFNTEVAFRVDGGGTTWLKLGVDQSNQVTSSKSTGDVEKLIGKLIASRNLEVEISPYSQAPLFVNFDLSTFDAAIARLKESCQK